MKTNGNDKALESYRIFPIVAWIVVISFFIFVYSLAMKLQTVADRLESQTLQLQEKINTAPTAETDFEIRTEKS